MADFNMGIREAVLNAANMIEARPELFNFNSTKTPDGDCGTPGCAIGWVAHFRGGDAVYKMRTGLMKGEMVWRAVPAVGMESHDFYRVMIDISRRIESDPHDWNKDAGACARCLREYAKSFQARVAA